MKRSFIKDILFSMVLTGIYCSHMVPSITYIKKIFAVIVIFICFMIFMESIDSFEKNLGKQLRRYARLASEQKKSAPDRHPKCTQLIR